MCDIVMCDVFGGRRPQMERQRHLAKSGIIAGKWHHLGQSILCWKIWNEAFEDSIERGENGAILSEIKNLFSLTNFHEPRAPKFGEMIIY